MTRASVIYWAGLFLTVSIKFGLVYLIAGGVSLLFLRHRPAWRSFVWLLTVGSFAWLTVLEWAGRTPHAAGQWIERVPDPSLFILAHVYVVLATLLAGLLVHSMVRLRLLCSYASPLNLGLTAQDPSGSGHAPEPIPQVTICVSGQVAVPTSFGILSPIIVLPAPPPETIYRPFVRAAVLHEFITVLRFDALWTLLARLVQCLYFFHPLVWLAFRHYCLAREQVCDRWTVRATADAVQYEIHLLALTHQPARGNLMAVDAPMARGRLANIRRRIADLQSDDRPQSLQAWSAVGALVVWLLLLAGIASFDLSTITPVAGLTWHLRPMLMGATAAVAVGISLATVVVIGHGRRSALVPPVDGWAGRSRQTIGECIQWLTREWQDVQLVLSLTARRLEPVLLVMLLLAATVGLWLVAAPTESSSGDRESSVPEARSHELRQH